MKLILRPALLLLRLGPALDSIQGQLRPHGGLHALPVCPPVSALGGANSPGAHGIYASAAPSCLGAPGPLGCWSAGLLPGPARKLPPVRKQGPFPQETQLCALSLPRQHPESQPPAQRTQPVADTARRPPACPVPTLLCHASHLESESFRAQAVRNFFPACTAVSPSTE